MSLALLLFPLLAILCGPALLMVLGRPQSVPKPQTRHKESSISIIIPARNEEDNIGKLLETLNQQSLSPHEILVVNDNSTDNTATVVKALGARVIDSKPLPSDWNGKPWACQQGAEAADGSWLLFLDADTELEADAIEKFSALTATNRVYSVCPFHRIEQTYEELSAFFNVLMLAGSDAFSIGTNAQPALFGQCMLISRTHYSKLGGHAAVKKEVLENFQLAAKLDALNIQRECYLGKGTIQMRMFPSGFSELWQSWQKGFTGGAANSAPRALLFSSIWISGLMFSSVSLVVLFSPKAPPVFQGLTAFAYLLNALLCCYAFRLAGSFSLLSAIFYPIALLFYQTLFFTALLRKRMGKTTTWKGREVS